MTRLCFSPHCKMGMWGHGRALLSQQQGATATASQADAVLKAVLVWLWKKRCTGLFLVPSSALSIAEKIYVYLIKETRATAWRLADRKLFLERNVDLNFCLVCVPENLHLLSSWKQCKLRLVVAVGGEGVGKKIHAAARNHNLSVLYMSQVLPSVLLSAVCSWAVPICVHLSVLHSGVFLAVHTHLYYFELTWVPFISMLIESWLLLLKFWGEV